MISEQPPPFNEAVILCNKQTKCVGKLIKVDERGNHWKLFVENTHWIGYRDFTHWTPLPESWYQTESVGENAP